MAPDGLDSLLDPASVAIVGLSSDPTKHGRRVLGHLRRLGYGGLIRGVNPRHVVLEDVEVFPSVRELPEAPEVLVCAVPGSALPAVLREGGERGAKAAIIFSGGFAETGPEGREAQDEIVRIARHGGMRILGPNSGGIIHPNSRVALSFLTCLDRPADEVRSGPVALVTQSGGTGSYLHNLAAARGGGLAASISTGNEADVGVAEAIAALAARAAVRAIAVVLETVRDGRAFVAAVRAAHEAGKPVAVCRLGTSDHGQRLMRSHTGALAAPNRVLEGVCDALGVTVTATPQELLDVAEVLACARPPAGDRLGVVTHSGGTAILISDLAAAEGLSLPSPPAALVDRVRPLLSHGSPGNPLDLGAIIGGPHRFAEVVAHFMDSGAYDVVLAVTTPHPPAHTLARAKTLADLRAGQAPASASLVNLWLAGDLGADGLALLRARGACVTEEPRAAVRAIAGLVGLEAVIARVPAEPDPAERDPLEAGGALGAGDPLEAGGPLEAGDPLSEHQAKTLLDRWGIPVVQGALAATAAQAREAAERIGYPVVVKVSSPDVPHKTDAGGVRLGLRTADEVARAFDEVMAAVALVAPDARVDGARVEQHHAGLEVIVGCVVDATFGPIVLAGLGGVEAEALQDVAVAPAPLSAAAAGRLLARLRGQALLDGSRRHGSTDREALARIISLVSRRFCGHTDRIAELELNPLTWAGGRWQAVDALVRLRPRDV